jgi:hypothetical protein
MILKGNFWGKPSCRYSSLCAAAGHRKCLRPQDTTLCCECRGLATGSYVTTVPQVVGGNAFEKAWYALTIDAQHAAFFEGLEEATAYYRNHPLKLQSRICLDVLRALERLGVGDRLGA